MQRDKKAAGPAIVSLKHSRRLIDDITVAFHNACDHYDQQSAVDLLKIMDRMVTHIRGSSTTETERRKELYCVLAAHERLWCLRHPNAII